MSFEGYDDNDVVNEKKAAELLEHWTPKQLRNMRYKGTGPAFSRVSHTLVLYRIHELKSWLDKIMKSTKNVQQSKPKPETKSTKPAAKSKRPKAKAKESASEDELV